MKKAIQHLNYALPMAGDEVTRERLHNRIEYFSAMGRALQQF